MSHCAGSEGAGQGVRACSVLTACTAIPVCHYTSDVVGDCGTLLALLECMYLHSVCLHVCMSECVYVCVYMCVCMSE